MSTLLTRILIFTTLNFMFACSLMSVGGDGSSAGGDDKKAMFEKLYEEVLAVDKDVDGTGGQWSNVEDLLKQAQSEAKGNNYEKAIQLTKEAHDFSLMAKQQYMEQQTARPTLF